MAKKRKRKARSMAVDFTDDVRVVGRGEWVLIDLQCEEGLLQLRFSAFGLKNLNAMVAQEYASNPRLEARANKHIRVVPSVRYEPANSGPTPSP